MYLSNLVLQLCALPFSKAPRRLRTVSAASVGATEDAPNMVRVVAKILEKVVTEHPQAVMPQLRSTNLQLKDFKN